jgi:hypothetical protein
LSCGRYCWLTSKPNVMPRICCTGVTPAEKGKMRADPAQVRATKPRGTCRRLWRF